MSKIIFERNIVTESMSEPKIDWNFLKRRQNKYKGIKGIILGDLIRARNDKNWEIAKYLEDLLKRCIKLERNRLIPLVEIEIVEGWKGTDNIQVIKGFENDFIIKSHTKDKENGEVTSVTHQIKAEVVNRLFFWIKRWKIGETHKCYDFALHLGYKSWKDLWREREDYFASYYYPIKVLEALGMIKYSGRGDVTRIK